MNADNPTNKVICGIIDGFKGHPKRDAILTRLLALASWTRACGRKRIKKWTREVNGELEYKDSVVDVASYYPIDLQTEELDFADGFEREIQRVTNHK